MYKEFKITDWCFNKENKKHNLPYVSFNNYLRILQIIASNKNVDDRINQFKLNGFKVKRCYVPTYNGIGNMTYMPKLNEIRLIVGRPKKHFCREVYAISFF